MTYSIIKFQKDCVKGTIETTVKTGLTYNEAEDYVLAATCHRFIWHEMKLEKDNDMENTTLKIQDKAWNEYPNLDNSIPTYEDGVKEVEILSGPYTGLKAYTRDDNRLFVMVFGRACELNIKEVKHYPCNDIIYPNIDDYRENFWNNNYKVLLTAQGIEFLVNADCEGDALDYIMDYVVDNDMPGLWQEYNPEGEEYTTAGNYGYQFTTHNIRIEKVQGND